MNAPPYPLSGLEWRPLGAEATHTLCAALLEVAIDQVPEKLALRARSAALPFYGKQRLVHVTDGDERSPGLSLFALWDGATTPLVVDGSSAPVHAANDREPLDLGAQHVPDYVRFFCFAVRGSEGAFQIVEPEMTGPAQKLAKPLRSLAPDGEGRERCAVTIAYGGSVFEATFAVAKDGAIEMVDDEPVAVLDAESASLETPRLDDVEQLRERLAIESFVADAKPRTRAATSATTDATTATGASTPQNARVVFVELLLERALATQRGNRLIDLFNATLPSSSQALDGFAALVTRAFPVVAVETDIPFVEETIAQIVLARSRPGGPFRLCKATVTGDGVDFALPDTGAALVLVPLQVYKRIGDIDRFAVDLARDDMAAIVTCDRAARLPESLRRLVDVTLHLPDVDASILERLFTRVMGAAPPAAWRSTGDDWVRHVLPSDFEHPRRMQLAPGAAFEYIRAQVMERLRAVDVASAAGLADLHGLGEARRFAEDLIADIHAAMRGAIPWEQVDRGALIVGPPGTGKTTLARAIARDCGVRFIGASVTGWQSAGDSLGPHLAAIRRTFAEARRYAPAIVFIDEVDTIGSRENFSGHNASYNTAVVNALLEQMQGLDPNEPVIVIAASNFEERVDPALRRSGRLDRVIRVPRPNVEALTKIYDGYVQRAGHAVDAAVDLPLVARLSLGLTGADVERIVRGAIRRARRAGRALAQSDLVDEVTERPRTSDGGPRITPEENERTCFHEAGHALALHLSASRGADIGFVTVVPRSDGTLGFVRRLPDERVSLTRRDYEEYLDVCLAGRAAEELRYGRDGISGGASNDLEVATGAALQLVTRLGLGTSGSLVVRDTPGDAHWAQVDELLAQSYARVLEALKRHQDRLQRLATELIARQELTGDQVRALLA